MKRVLTMLIVIAFSVSCLVGCSASAATYPITLDNGEEVRLNYSLKDITFDKDTLTFTSGDESVRLTGAKMDAISEGILYCDDVTSEELTGKVKGYKYTLQDTDGSWIIVYDFNGAERGMMLLGQNKDLLETVDSSISLKPSKDNGSVKQNLLDKR